MRWFLPWAVWWAISWWGFVLLAGDWNRIEWIAGAAIATVAATLIELLRAAAGIELHPSFGPLRALPSAFAQVFVDFGLLMVALVRRQPGTYVVRDAPPADPTEQALTVLVAGLSPNAYVVDLDPERSTVLLHDLVERRASERPA